ncbi:hypothetical protein MNBD_GAMMA01-1849 [hydrothermal vent metagenome]|uniref:Glycosyltransferase RgtA/B/C/D-like domain-containing protein n=1 Tax=hydrothermal vent metagenome TaxID=652676 RepID=A0A3B0VY77_9ZZZZ
MINIIIMFILYLGVGIPLYWLLSNKQENWQKCIGESFFVGVFIVIIFLNIMQLLEMKVNMTIIFYVILILSLLSISIYLYKNYVAIKKLSYVGFTYKSQIFYAVALMLILVHMYYIISQNQALPLTPWDSWYGWIAKAKIWFYHSINEPLIERGNWLLSVSQFTSPTTHYPDGLSLLYVFNAGFFGWHETHLNGLYPAMFIAFLFAFYGNIKLLTKSTNYAWLALVLLVTIPFINVHVTLAGYADIWVAVYLTLSLFSLQHFLSQPRITGLLLAILFMFAMILFKLESWVWLSIFVLVFMLSLVSKIKRKWTYLAILSATIIWYLNNGFSITFGFGELIIKPDLLKIPALGSYSLAFTNTTVAWLEALFFSNNWHLLWYSIPLVVVLFLKTKDKSLLILPCLYLVCSTIFLYVLFYLTYASVFANDFTSSNRVVLHIVPVYIYFLIQVMYQYRLQKSGSLSQLT